MRIIKELLTKLTKAEKLIAVVVSLALVGAFLSNSFAFAATNLSGGDILQGKNITASETTYHEGVTADNGDKVRFRVRVVNQGTENATNIKVKFNLGSGTAPTVTLTSDNAGSQTDFVNLNPGGASLAFVSGSGLKYGPPSCANGCATGDDIVGTGVNIGTLEPGEVKSYQLSIEANVVGTPGTQLNPVFRGGNIYDGGNRIDRTTDWGDPIAADPGEVIEFRVQVINDGTGKANGTSVKAVLPSTPSTSIKTTAFVSAASADTVSDIATVNVSGTVGQVLVYLPGHTIKWGPGCVNGCAMPDGITVHGITVGDVDPGATNSFQVTFKATVSNVVEATPNPTSKCVVLNANPTDGTSPVTVNFTGQGEDTGGNIQEYEFDFGDSSNGQQQVVKTTSTTASHVYNNNGTFTAKLKVRDSRNNWLTAGSCEKVITVHAPQTNPTSRCVDLIASTSNGTEDLTVNFTGQGEDTGGNIAEYEFNFGDSSNGQNQVVKTNGNTASHTYFNSGTFNASLIVKDSRGVWQGGDQCKVNITVNAKPTVLSAQTPTKLPRTGSEAAIVIPALSAVGYYLYKRFKLL